MNQNFYERMKKAGQNQSEQRYIRFPGYVTEKNSLFSQNRLVGTGAVLF